MLAGGAHLRAVQGPLAANQLRLYAVPLPASTAALVTLPLRAARCAGVPGCQTHVPCQLCDGHKPPATAYIVLDCLALPAGNLM